MKVDEEYKYMVDRFTDLAGFPIIISTFQLISEEEKEGLFKAAKVLQQHLEYVIPRMSKRRDGEII